MPAPPWHYVGDFLVIEYWAEPDAVAAVLPPGLEPFAEDPGPLRRAVRRLAVAARTPARSCSTRCAASTRSSSSSSTRVLDGEHVTTCPYIWVDTRLRAGPRVDPGLPQEARADRDDALVRPRLPGRGPDAFAGTLAANGRRLAQGTVTPERDRRGRADPQRPAARQPPPLPAAGRRPARRPGRATSWCGPGARNRSISPIHEGTATLELFGAPNEEHDRAGAGADGQAASASRSPTRWTTSRRSPSCERRRARHRRRHRHRRRRRPAAGRRRLSGDGQRPPPGAARAVAGELGCGCDRRRHLGSRPARRPRSTHRRGAGRARRRWSATPASAARARSGADAGGLGRRAAHKPDRRVPALPRRAAPPGRAAGAASSRCRRWRRCGRRRRSAAYCVSKAGMVMLMQSIAVDYGPKGVRANAVCPGWVRTDMADEAMDEVAEHARHRPRGRLPPRAPAHADAAPGGDSEVAGLVSLAALAGGGRTSTVPRSRWTAACSVARPRPARVCGGTTMSTVAGIAVSARPLHRRAAGAQRRPLRGPLADRLVACSPRSRAAARPRSTWPSTAADGGLPGVGRARRRRAAPSTCAGWPT